MSLGNHTFWVVVSTDGLAVTAENDKRYSLRFTSPEAARAYAQKLPGYYTVVEVRA